MEELTCGHPFVLILNFSPLCTPLWLLGKDQVLVKSSKEILSNATFQNWVRDHWGVSWLPEAWERTGSQIAEKIPETKRGGGRGGGEKRREKGEEKIANSNQERKLTMKNKDRPYLHKSVLCQGENGCFIANLV